MEIPKVLGQLVFCSRNYGHKIVEYFVKIIHLIDCTCFNVNIPVLCFFFFSSLCVKAEAVVQEQFMVSEEGKKNKVPVAGCRCIKGNLNKNAKYKIIRDGVEVYRGTYSYSKSRVSVCVTAFVTSVVMLFRAVGIYAQFEDGSFIYKN